MTVNPESLHGLIKKAIIRLPMVRNLRLIDVPGLQELDPYGYAVALEGLAHVYGRYESLVLVMSNNGASADVTKALQGAWAKHLQGRVLDGAVQIIPFHPLDKVEKLQTVEQQTRNKGPGLVMRAIARKTGEQLAYVRTIFETDRSVGIASPALKLDPQEISRRLNLLMAAIKPLTANVRLQNPDRDVKHVSDLVQMLSEFTASRWRSETEALYKSVIRELSTVVRILHSFSQIDSPATIQSILMEIKRRAAKVGAISAVSGVGQAIYGSVFSMGSEA